jgi:hypothetical protein
MHDQDPVESVITIDRNAQHEHHAAFLSASGAVRSGLNPSLFSDASRRATQIVRVRLLLSCR